MLLRQRRAASAVRAALLAACAVFLASGAAFADWGMVAVLDTDASTKDIIQAKAEDYLRGINYEVLGAQPAADVGASVDEIKRCLGEGADCMSMVLVAASVDRLVVIEAKHPGKGTVLLEGKLFDGADGSRLRTEQRKCESCDVYKDLGPMVEQLVAALFERELLQKSGETFIEVQSTPPEALVFIDDREAGPSGKSYRVTPGLHKVRLERKGYASSERQVTVAPNTTQIVKVEMVAVGSVEVPNEEVKGEQRYATLKWVALGSGVALGALGGVGIALHGRSRFDGDERLEKEWGTLPHGIGASIAGGLLLGAAAYMFISDSSAKPSERVSLELYEGGMGIGWASSF